MDESKVDEMISEVDIDGDGAVSEMVTVDQL